MEDTYSAGNLSAHGRVIGDRWTRHPHAALIIRTAYEYVAQIITTFLVYQSRVSRKNMAFNECRGMEIRKNGRMPRICADSGRAVRCPQNQAC